MFLDVIHFITIKLIITFITCLFLFVPYSGDISEWLAFQVKKRTAEKNCIHYG